MKDKKLPDFLLIGAMKCGTTSLFTNLCKHSKVVPAYRKETHFLCQDYVDVDEYISCFLPCHADQICGEGSTDYIWDKRVPKHVRKIVPDIKVVAMLRHPIVRLVSQYYAYLRKCKKLDNAPISLDFDDFVEKSFLDPTQFNASGNHAMEKSKYGQQLLHWFGFIPIEQFHIIISEEFYADMSKHYNDVLKFLKLRPEKIGLTHELPTRQLNMNELGRHWNENPSKDTYKRLLDFYREDIRLLEELLNRKMDWK